MPPKKSKSQGKSAKKSINNTPKNRAAAQTTRHFPKQDVPTAGWVKYREDLSLLESEGLDPRFLNYGFKDDVEIEKEQLKLYKAYRTTVLLRPNNNGLSAQHPTYSSLNAGKGERIFQFDQLLLDNNDEGQSGYNQEADDSEAVKHNTDDNTDDNTAAAGANDLIPTSPPRTFVQPPAEVAAVAVALKEKGNHALANGDLESAIYLYTEAIEFDDTNAVFFSNRAAVFSKLDQHDKAIEDCHEALARDPKYVKAFSRLGLAYFSKSNFQKSVAAYQHALQLEPSNTALQRSLSAARSELSIKSASPSKLKRATKVLHLEEQVCLADKVQLTTLDPGERLRVLRRASFLATTTVLDDYFPCLLDSSAGREHHNSFMETLFQEANLLTHSGESFPELLDLLMADYFWSGPPEDSSIDPYEAELQFINFDRRSNYTMRKHAVRFCREFLFSDSLAQWPTDSVSHARRQLRASSSVARSGVDPLIFSLLRELGDSGNEDELPKRKNPSTFFGGPMGFDSHWKLWAMELRDWGYDTLLGLESLPTALEIFKVDEGWQPSAEICHDANGSLGLFAHTGPHSGLVLRALQTAEAKKHHIFSSLGTKASNPKKLAAMVALPPSLKVARFSIRGAFELPTPNAIDEALAKALMSAGDAKMYLATSAAIREKADEIQKFERDMSAHNAKKNDPFFFTTAVEEYSSPDVPGVLLDGQLARKSTSLFLTRPRCATCREHDRESLLGPGLGQQDFGEVLSRCREIRRARRAELLFRFRDLWSQNFGASIWDLTLSTSTEADPCYSLANGGTTKFSGFVFLVNSKYEVNDEIYDESPALRNFAREHQSEVKKEIDIGRKAVCVLADAIIARPDTFESFANPEAAQTWFESVARLHGVDVARHISSTIERLCEFLRLLLPLSGALISLSVCRSIVGMLTPVFPLLSRRQFATLAMADTRVWGDSDFCLEKFTVMWDLPTDMPWVLRHPHWAPSWLIRSKRCGNEYANFNWVKKSVESDGLLSQQLDLFHDLSTHKEEHIGPPRVSAHVVARHLLAFKNFPTAADILKFGPQKHADSIDKLVAASLAIDENTDPLLEVLRPANCPPHDHPVVFPIVRFFDELLGRCNTDLFAATTFPKDLKLAQDDLGKWFGVESNTLPFDSTSRTEVRTITEVGTDELVIQPERWARPRGSVSPRRQALLRVNLPTTVWDVLAHASSRVLNYLCFGVEDPTTTAPAYTRSVGDPRFTADRTLACVAAALPTTFSLIANAFGHLDQDLMDICTVMNDTARMRSREIPPGEFSQIHNAQLIDLLLACGATPADAAVREAFAIRYVDCSMRGTYMTFVGPMRLPATNDRHRAAWISAEQKGRFAHRDEDIEDARHRDRVVLTIEQRSVSFWADQSRARAIATLSHATAREQSFLQLTGLLASMLGVQSHAIVFNPGVFADADTPLGEKPQRTCNQRSCVKAGTKKCSRCLMVYYCSAACQIADWPEHKRNCKPAKA